MLSFPLLVKDNWSLVRYLGELNIWFGVTFTFWFAQFRPWASTIFNVVASYPKYEYADPKRIRQVPDKHYSDVIMDAMASQIVGITIVYWTVYSGRSKKTSKLRITGLCAGISPVTGKFPAQMTSNEENASIWWRHHVGAVQVVNWIFLIYLMHIEKIHVCDLTGI